MAGSSDSAGGTGKGAPEGHADDSAREQERIRRKLGLTQLEMAIATGFSEQRDGRPIVVPPEEDDDQVPGADT